MGITISELDAVASADNSHAIPAMKDGVTVKLTVSQISTLITALLVDSAPATLDTLNELAAALGDDPNFATTVTNALATKASLTGAETLTNKTLTKPLINGPSGEFLRGHINGLTLSNNVTDATNDIDIAAGSAASDGTTPVLITLASGITKRLDAAWAVGTGNGGLDTGSIANSWYFVWAIRRSDTGVVDVLFSSSSTSPTMPANYDQKRLVGVVFRSGGAIVPFKQRGDDFTWVTPVEAFSNTTISTTGELVTVAAPAVTNTQAKIRGVLSSGGSVHAWVRDTAQVNDTPTLSNCDLAVAAASVRSLIFKPLNVDSSSQIRYRSDAASVGSFVVSCEGFIFHRGSV